MKKITLILFLFAINHLFAQNQLLSSIDESYDASTNTYSNSSGFDYAYDANGNLTSETYYFWDSTLNNWVPNYRDNFIYNSNGKVSTVVYESYNTSSNQFEIDERQVNTYNSSGNLIGELYEDFTNGTYVNSFRSVYNYQNGRIVSLSFDDWDGTQWVVDEFGTLNYTNNILTSAIYEEMVNGNLAIYGREVFTRNSNGFITNSSFDFYNGTSYVPDEVTDYTIDANGNRLSEINSYNPTTTPNDKEDYTYDTSIQMSNLDSPFKDKTGLEYVVEDNPHFNKVLSRTYSNYNDTSMSFQLSSRVTYNYNSTLSNEDVVSIDSISIKLFPNPTSNLVTVEATNTIIKQVELYDMLGKKVFSTTQTTFEIGQLIDGLYVLKIEDQNGSIINRKLVKK